MGSFQADISVQVAVTKKPGSAMFGEENTWLDDIRSLLPTGKLQGRGPRPRVPATVRPLNKRSPAKAQLLVITHYQRQDNSGSRGSVPGPQRWGIIAQPSL